jgi:hypothetical protein
MGIARRRFVGLLGRIAAAGVVPASSLAGRVIPVRYVEAIRDRFYPVPVKRLSRNDIRKPGRWGG